MVRQNKYSEDLLSGIYISDTQIRKILKTLENDRQNSLLSYYKLTNFEQSILHRCWLTNCHTIKDYWQLLSDSTVEKNKLYNHLISGTTRFFRDRHSWEWLATEIIPRLLKKNSQSELKCWIVGCATGEEAYSLAILLKEQIAATSSQQNFKILATDINISSLEIARRGIYSQNITECVSQKRLEQNFVSQNGNFKINSELRQKIVFATHNIVTDIGYKRIDLICCRNLLVYLRFQYQCIVLHSLRNSLKSEGILFIDKYESIPTTLEGFDKLPEREEFFQKKQQRNTSIKKTCSIESNNNIGFSSPIEELRYQQLIIEKINQELKAANQFTNDLNQKYLAQVRQLKELNLDLETLLQSIGIGVIFLDRKLNIRKYNFFAQKIFRFQTIDLGRPLKDIQHNLDCTDLVGLLEEFVQTKLFKPLEVENTETGDFLLMNVSACSLGSESIEGVVLTFVDISDRKKAEMLRHQAFYDSLTGLPNRLLFKEQLQHALTRLPRQNSPFLALLYLDLNGFKEVNDTLGHGAGDLLLIEVARRLTRVMRSNDIVCRLGGDEFAILLEEIDNLEQSIEIASRIHQILSNPFFIKDNQITISTSIGINFCSAEDELNSNTETLMENADMAMYNAKQKGTAKTEIFQHHMRSLADATIKIKDRVCQAISDEEFLLHYQPIYSLSNGKFLGFEALLRWNHPELGLISPEQFLPSIQNSPLLFKLECLVIKLMYAQLQYWLQKFQLNESFRLNVNISPKLIIHNDFLGYFQTVINPNNKGIQHLTIELTETALINNPQKVKKILELLRDRGIKIALDDFGTGFSSLSHLHYFPLDIIKIDRSFLMSLHDGDRSSHIVRSIIYMSQQLNLTTVAEGIENLNQLQLLKEYGCHRGQGYFWHPPLTSDVATELIASESK